MKHMSTASSGSLTLQRIKLGYALETRDTIMFEFYLGLPTYCTQGDNKVLRYSIFMYRRLGLLGAHRY